MIEEDLSSTEIDWPQFWGALLVFGVIFSFVYVVYNLL